MGRLYFGFPLLATKNCLELSPMKLKSSHMILTLLAVALLLALFVSAGGSQDESLSDLGSRRDLASSSAGGDKGVVAIGTYHLKHTLAHDPRCFTQGLVYKNGFMYESCGLYGKSWLRKIDWQTGAVVHMYKDFDKSVFAEGITIIGGRLYMLTWQSRHLFVFDADTLQPLFTTRFHSHKQGEGWGLTTDGEHLIATDGSSRVLYLTVPTKEGEEATKVRELIVMESAAENIEKAQEEELEASKRVIVAERMQFVGLDFREFDQAHDDNMRMLRDFFTKWIGAEDPNDLHLTVERGPALALRASDSVVPSGGSLLQLNRKVARRMRGSQRGFWNNQESVSGL